MKLAILALVTAGAAFAASWDGNKGPLAIATFTFSSGIGSDAPPGVPVIPVPHVWHTTIFVKCSDPTVTAVRIRVSYHDASGAHTTIFLSELVSGYGGATMPLPLDQIDEVRFTELRDGASY